MLHDPAVALSGAVETITPDAAREMLRLNTGNRKPRASTIEQWAKDMQAGAWLVTHQGIAVAPDGRLLDGQHRLMAIVRAGVSVRMLVFRNADPQTFAAIDGGNIRSLRDRMKVDGRILDPCVFIARLHGAERVGSHHLEPIVSGPVGEAILEMIATVGGAAKGRTTAPIKAAIALRMMKRPDRPRVLAQWKAFGLLDYASMCPSVQALCRVLTDAPARLQHNGSTMQTDRAARAWLAFDPRRAAVSRIQVNDLRQYLGEMRDAWRPDWASSLETA